MEPYTPFWSPNPREGWFLYQLSTSCTVLFSCKGQGICKWLLMVVWAPWVYPNFPDSSPSFSYLHRLHTLFVLSSEHRIFCLPSSPVKIIPISESLDKMSSPLRSLLSLKISKNVMWHFIPHYCCLCLIIVNQAPIFSRF